MIVFNKTKRVARDRLVARSWERPYLRFKVAVRRYNVGCVWCCVCGFFLQTAAACCCHDARAGR
jgi:hypothetical protein